MSRAFYKYLALFLGMALGLFAVRCLKIRQELRAATAANTILRQTLSDLTAAIANKDREIDRMTEPPCGGKKEPRERLGPARWTHR